MQATSQAAEPRKQRLLVLASTYPRWKGDHEPGFVHELCRRLAADFDVVVICPAAPRTRGREVMDGVRIRRFRYAPGRLQLLVNDGGITTNLRRDPWKYLLVPGFLLSMLVASVIEIRRFRPSVIHAHWVLPQSALAAIVRRFSKGRRPRLVATSHGADLYGWRSWPFSAVKRWTLGQVDALTVVSHAMVRDVEAIGCAAQPSIHVAPMGVDLAERFQPDAAVARIPGQMLFVGRLVEKKGLRHLLAAMPEILSRVPGATLVIAGFGPEEAARRRQASELGVGHAVRFIGAVPQEELPALYRQASVFVAPFVEAAGGDREGLGLVLVEAAACGCPVVVGDVPAVHDVFATNEAEFVAPGDPAAIADAVVSVLDGSGRAKPPSRDALVDRFDWDGVAKRYGRLLASVSRGVL